MADHFTINVARRVKSADEAFGPYHVHLFAIVMPDTTTKQEASELYDDVRTVRFPEPYFECTLMQHIDRYTTIHSSAQSPQAKVSWVSLPHAQQRATPAHNQEQSA